MFIALGALLSASRMAQPNSERASQRGIMPDSQGHLGYTDENGKALDGVETPFEGIRLENDEAIETRSSSDKKGAEGDPTLKAQGVLMRELEVCANGLKAHAADWQERANSVLSVAGALPSVISDMRGAGVPLHQSFMYNALMLQMALYQLGTWSISVLTSPYYNQYATNAINLAQFASDAAVDLKMRRSHMGIAHPMKKGKSIALDLIKGLKKAKKLRPSPSPSPSPLPSPSPAPWAAYFQEAIAKNPWFPRHPMSSLNGRNAAKPGDAFNAFWPYAPLAAHATGGATLPRKNGFLLSPSATAAKKAEGDTKKAEDDEATEVSSGEEPEDGTEEGAEEDTEAEAADLEATDRETEALLSSLEKASLLQMPMPAEVDVDESIVEEGSQGQQRRQKQQQQLEGKTNQTDEVRPPAGLSAAEYEHDLRMAEQQQQQQAQVMQQEEAQVMQQEEAHVMQQQQDARFTTVVQQQQQQQQQSNETATASQERRQELVRWHQEQVRLQRQQQQQRRQLQLQETVNATDFAGAQAAAAPLSIESAAPTGAWESMGYPGSSAHQADVNWASQQAAGDGSDSWLSGVTAGVLGLLKEQQPEGYSAGGGADADAIAAATAALRAAMAPAAPGQQAAAEPAPKPMPPMATSLEQRDGTQTQQAVQQAAPVGWPTPSLALPAMQRPKTPQQKAIAMTAAIGEARAKLTWAGGGVGDLLERSSAMQDQLVCVKNTLKGLVDTQYDLPVWVSGIAQQLVTAGGVVWQLWHLIFNNRMSGYYAASMLLRVCMLYLNAQQQSVLSTFSQRLGPFAGVQLISPSEIASALPG